MKQTEEEFFKDLISKSKLEMPAADFEETVMTQIKREKIPQQFLSREIKLSWVFIIIVVVLGTSLSLLISQLQPIYFVIPLRSVKIVFEFIFIVFVLLQIDTLLKYSFRRKETRLRNQLRKLTQEANNH